MHRAVWTAAADIDFPGATQVFRIRRDTAWREKDQYAYAGSGAHTMATLRTLALGLFRPAGITSIKRTLERIVGDRTRILPIVENRPRSLIDFDVPLGYYDRHRPHSTLDYQTPEEHEDEFAEHTLTAA